MAERCKARKIEKAAIAFDRVNEAENGIEARAISRIRLPGDDLARAGFQHFACFCDEVRQQVIHCARAPKTCETILHLKGAYERGWLMKAY